jgi:hypothetical protein
VLSGCGCRIVCLEKCTFAWEDWSTGPWHSRVWLRARSSSSSSSSSSRDCNVTAFLKVKADSTQGASQAVPHPSTGRALCRLTSEVRRDPVHSTRYGRQRRALAAKAGDGWRTYVKHRKSTTNTWLERISDASRLFGGTADRERQFRGDRVESKLGRKGCKAAKMM